MTEEEKKVLELSKVSLKVAKDSNMKNMFYNTSSLDILLNLIENKENKIASQEKQIKLMQSCDLAKEIRNLQEEIEGSETRLQEEINENCKLKAELYGNSISKDEIRRLMNHYKEEVEKISKEEKEWKHMNEEQKMKHNIQKRRWTSYYYAYKELLEE